MNAVKIRVLLLGFSVAALAVTLGAALWITQGPPRFGVPPSRPSGELSIYAAVPDFFLTERSGKQVTLAQLRGTVWVADFIYTSCQDTCPLETATMAKLQERLKNTRGVSLVSFSVDPEHDTPGVLSRYADRFGADANRWLFLTGPKVRITHLIQEGFHLGAAPAPSSGPEANEISHSTRFVLVDQHAQIRGYYNSLDPRAVRRLREDIAGLLEN